MERTSGIEMSLIPEHVGHMTDNANAVTCFGQINTYLMTE